jgi:hypothetical protein
MFHVFVEGAADDAAGAVPRLADAIAKHYGLPAGELRTRLEAGRLRVKGNIDRATAETYVRDLERLGARCTIEPASPANSQRATPLPFPAVRPDTAPPARPSSSSLPPAPAKPAAGPATANLPRALTPPPVAGYQSGLAAAFSGDAPAASLGALEGDDVPLALATVDGSDDASASPAGSFEPPGGGGLPASIGPAPAENAAAKTKPAKPKDVPVDMFAPPDMQGEELKVDIAADEIEVSARKRASTPPASVPVVPAPDALAAPASRDSQPALRRSQPLAGTTPEPSVTTRASKLGPLAEPRTRFAAGVVLALLLGFVPAHLVAASREDAAYREIDHKVLAAQELADTPEVYATLDRMRAAQLRRKESERRNAAIIAFAVWALVGGGLAFVWFRKLPWDDWT